MKRDLQCQKLSSHAYKGLARKVKAPLRSGGFRPLSESIRTFHAAAIDNNHSIWLKSIPRSWGGEESLTCNVSRRSVRLSLRESYLPYLMGAMLSFVGKTVMFFLLFSNVIIVDAKTLARIPSDNFRKLFLPTVLWPNLSCLFLFFSLEDDSFSSLSFRISYLLFSASRAV